MDLPDWYRALTLAERASIPEHASIPSPPGASDPERAGKRLERWRAEPGFVRRDDLLRQRLAQDGLTEEEFLALLGEPAERLRERWLAGSEPPGWIGELAAAFTGEAPPTDPLQPKGLSAVLEPLVHRGRERLLRGIERIGGIGGIPLRLDTGEVAAQLLLHLRTRLGRMVNRALVLELQVAARAGKLSGDTPEERFQSFAEHLRRPEAGLEFLREYPVLARHCAEAMEDWLAFSLEILGHLAADWDALRESLHGGADLGVLTEIEGGLGDSHRGGRSVRILHFDSGLRLVYKPKPLAVEVAFQNLLAWFGARGARPGFRSLRVLDRGDYGWVEFVRSAGCASPEEVRRFYQRQGAFLAVFYMLGATDFHHENLIAAGEHPMPIDLEALFHPRVKEPPVEGEALLADEAILDSVLRVGLLPQRIWNGEENREGVDLSGLGAVSGQRVTSPFLQIADPGTDRMHFTRKSGTMREVSSRPTLGGNEVRVEDYIGEIVEGFTDTYRLAAAHRDELLAPGGPLDAFSGAEIRVIARPTRIYSLLLSESYHPFVVQDALDRDRLFDRLWITVQERPPLAALVPHEHRDLVRGDIPLFTTRPGSRDAWSSAGERIPGVLEEPGLDAARRFVAQLGEEDLERQLRIVHGTLSSLTLQAEGLRWPAFRVKPGEAPAGRERLLAAARAVGDRLEATAYREGRSAGLAGSGGSAAWCGYAMLGAGAWTYQTIGYELYNGLAGIALFLGYLGAVTGEDRYTDLGRAALATIRGRRARSKWFLQSIGAFSGWGGLIYALTHLGTLWNEPELLAEAESAVAELPERIAEDRALDMIGGSTGCALALLGLHAVRPSPSTLAAAALCGDHLVERAQPVEHGLAWWTTGSGSVPLTGISHGAAGMAMALAELASATGDERYRRAAHGALAYERSLFSEEEGNWPDLRSEAAEVHHGGSEFMCVWCHGAPGIGLARLACLPHLDDPGLRREIDVAVATTLKAGFGRNQSLCHGDLGNLELVLEAALTLDDPDLRDHAYRIAAGLLPGIDEHGWMCGAPLGIESPGLMTGLSGIGYELLRLAAPDRVPSVLSLAPPCKMHAVPAILASRLSDNSGSTKGASHVER
jgi:type 2 lantibiotic biosynthesis protein LanM